MIRRVLIFIFICIPLVAYYGNVKPPLLVGSETADRKFVNVIPENTEKKNSTPNFPTFWGGSSLTQEDKTVSDLKITSFTLEGGGLDSTQKGKTFGKSNRSLRKRRV